MSGGASSGQSRGEDLTPEEFTALRGPLSGFFRDFVGQELPGAFDFQAPRGADELANFRAPFTTGEQQALSALSAQQGGTATESASDALLRQTLGGDFLTAGGANPALRDVIRFTNQAINETFDAEDLERSALFARAGQRIPESSPFAQAQAESGTGRLRAVGENTSRILFGAFEAERGRQVQAVEQARANAGFTLQRSTEILRAEALPRLIDQLGIEGGQREFEVRLAALTNALGIAANLADVSAAQVSSNQSKQGGISSARYKDSFAPVDSSVLDRLKVVSFRYRPGIEDGGKRRHVGVIAEQLADLAPDLVRFEDGKPEAVYYDDMVPLLLDKIQKLETRLSEAGL